MMHLRRLLPVLLFLPSGARRSTRVDDSYQVVQQQNKRFADELKMSAESRETLIPGLFRAGLFPSAGPRAVGLRERLRSPSPKAELGLAAPDPLTISGSIFVLGGFAWFQNKVRYATEKRKERDAAAEAFRKAQVLLLGGKMEAEAVEQAKIEFQNAAQDYDDARRLATLGDSLLRIPDPNAAEIQRLLGEQSRNDDQTRELEPRTEQESEPLDRVRGILGLKQQPGLPSKSVLPSGEKSVTPKDIAIGLVFLLQIAWFLVSLTDPIGSPNALMANVLSAGGDFVDNLEASKTRESTEDPEMLEAMAEPAEGSEIIPSDIELQRTRGLDANRNWIVGKPTEGIFPD